MGGNKRRQAGFGGTRQAITAAEQTMRPEMSRGGSRGGLASAVPPHCDPGDEGLVAFGGMKKGREGGFGVGGVIS